MSPPRSIMPNPIANIPTVKAYRLDSYASDLRFLQALKGRMYAKFDLDTQRLIDGMIALVVRRIANG